MLAPMKSPIWPPMSPAGDSSTVRAPGLCWALSQELPASNLGRIPPGAAESPKALAALWEWALALKWFSC